MMNIHLIGALDMYLQLDTDTDKFNDKMRRGGSDRSGDLTRPLKSRKMNFLLKHWWGKPEDYVWYDHRGRGFNHTLSHKNVQCLKPENDVSCAIIDAYSDLLKIREKKAHNGGVFHPPCKKFFIFYSYFLTLAKNYCTNCKVNHLFSCKFCFAVSFLDVAAFVFVDFFSVLFSMLLQGKSSILFSVFSVDSTTLCQFYQIL